MTEYKKHKGSIHKGFFPPSTDLRNIKLKEVDGVAINVVSGCFLTGIADDDGNLILDLADFATAPDNDGTTDAPLYMALESSADWDVDKLHKLSVVRLYPGLVIETTEFDTAANKAGDYDVGDLVTAGTVNNVAGKLVAAPARNEAGGKFVRVIGRVVQKPTANLHWGDPMDPVKSVLIEVTMDVRQTA